MASNAALTVVQRQREQRGFGHTVLGGDLVTPTDLMRGCEKVVYSPGQIEQLTESLPNEEVLLELKKDGFGLMPQPPFAMNLLDVRSLEEPTLFRRIDWYREQPFATQNFTGNGWFAMKKTPATNSTGGLWKDQNALVRGFDYVPNAAEASWFITMFFKVRKERLFQTHFGNTSDLASEGDRINIGGFTEEGLAINGNWRKRSDDRLGLLLARKV